MTGSARDNNLAVVRKLCERWPWMTREEYAECLAPDSVYINVPRPEKRRIGPDEAHEALSPWRDRCRIGLEVIHIQGDESVVLTERLERFESLTADGGVIELYVMGAFEMKDGKIAQWRDYFEGAQAPSAAFAPAAG